MIDQQRLQELDEMLQKARSRITEAKRIGTSVDGAELLLKAATTAINDSDIEKAIENAHDAIIAAEQKLSNRVSEAVQQAFRKLEEQGTIFKVPKAEMKLKKAKQAVEKKDSHGQPQDEMKQRLLPTLRFVEQI